MLAHTLKQDVLETLQNLPDNADIEEIMYRLYVLENIRRGQQDAEHRQEPPPSGAKGCPARAGSWRTL